MKSAPGLRCLYPRPERRGFTPLLVNPHAAARRQASGFFSPAEIAPGLRYNRTIEFFRKNAVYLGRRAAE